MAFTVKSDHIIMDQLGVTELRHLIAETNKGSLTLMLRKGETSYRLVLDAIPLEEPTNKELMAMLFPVKQMEVPQVNMKAIKGIDMLPPDISFIYTRESDASGKPIMATESQLHMSSTTLSEKENVKLSPALQIPKKKGGRPKGSKNK